MDFIRIVISFVLILLTACAPLSSSEDIFHDANMDFGLIQTIAILPIGNLTRDQLASDRVRDVLVTKLMATGSIYVIPVGEVTRVIISNAIANPSAPSKDDMIKLATVTKSDVLITGVLREYGEVRSGTTSANVISLSLQMTEGQTGRVVWSASSTKGGITMKERLLGGGGDPLNYITEKAVDDLINKLFI